MEEVISKKQCTKCKETFPATTQHFYKSGKEKLSSWCKTCQNGQAKKYYAENREEGIINRRKHYYENQDYYTNFASNWYKNNKKQAKDKLKKWQKDNPEKVKDYNQKRKHKKHKITLKEWNACKEYFNFECAYCGTSEEEHKKQHKQQLHKEHVIHEGRDDIKNCVPSCRSCNSKKHIYTLNNWYNSSNPDYTKERYLKICQWVRHDCKK